MTHSSPTGERWTINVSAMVVVAAVIVAAVAVWALTSNGDGTADSAAPTASIAASTPADISPSVASSRPAASLPPTSRAVATTTETAASTTPPTTVQPPPVTTAPGAEPGAVPGDLAVPGHPMTRPPCDGSYITVIGSPAGEQATAASVGLLLERYPGSSYLRADQTCPSLRPSLDGAPIYLIYLGPFAFEIDACTARRDGSPDAYPRRLSDELESGHFIDCDAG